MAAGRGSETRVLDGSVDSYLDHLATERGLARRSVEAYGRDLTAFVRGLVVRRVRSPTAIGAEDVRAHLVALADARPVAAQPGARAGGRSGATSAGWPASTGSPTDPAAARPHPAAAGTAAAARSGTATSRAW